MQFRKHSNIQPKFRIRLSTVHDGQYLGPLPASDGQLRHSACTGGRRHLPSAEFANARSKNNMGRSSPLVHLSVGWVWIRPGRRTFSRSHEGKARTQGMEAINVLAQNLQANTTRSSPQRLLRDDCYSFSSNDRRSRTRFRAIWQHERFLGDSIHSLGRSSDLLCCVCAGDKEAKVAGGSSGLESRGQTRVLVCAQENSEPRA